MLSDFSIKGLMRYSGLTSAEDHQEESTATTNDQQYPVKLANPESEQQLSTEVPPVKVEKKSEKPKPAARSTGRKRKLPARYVAESATLNNRSIRTDDSPEFFNGAYSANVKPRRMTRNSQKRQSDEVENPRGFGVATRNSSVYKRYFPRIQAQIRKIVFASQMLETYDQDGWRRSNQKKLRPETELAKARKNLRDAKRMINLLLHDLMEGEEAQSEVQLMYNEADSINESNIFCAVCLSPHSDDQNDIILCDLEGCNRAFHMQCLDPPATREEVLGDLTKDWFCRRCMTMIECMNEVSGRLGETGEWRDLYPLEELDAEQAMDDAEMSRKNATKVSKRGRKIVPPRQPVSNSEKSGDPNSWDAHSFASDTDDENFNFDALNESSISSGESDEIGLQNGEDHSSSYLPCKRAVKRVDYRALAAVMFADEKGTDNYLSEPDDDYVEGHMLSETDHKDDDKCGTTKDFLC